MGVGVGSIRMSAKTLGASTLQATYIVEDAKTAIIQQKGNSSGALGLGNYRVHAQLISTQSADILTFKTFSTHVGGDNNWVAQVHHNVKIEEKAIHAPSKDLPIGADHMDIIACKVMSLYLSKYYDRGIRLQVVRDCDSKGDPTLSAACTHLKVLKEFKSQVEFQQKYPSQQLTAGVDCTRGTIKSIPIESRKAKDGQAVKQVTNYSHGFSPIEAAVDTVQTPTQELGFLLTTEPSSRGFHKFYDFIDSQFSSEDIHNGTPVSQTILSDYCFATNNTLVQRFTNCKNFTEYLDLQWEQAAEGHAAIQLHNEAKKEGQYYPVKLPKYSKNPVTGEVLDVYNNHSVWIVLCLFHVFYNVEMWFKLNKNMKNLSTGGKYMFKRITMAMYCILFKSPELVGVENFDIFCDVLIHYGEIWNMNKIVAVPSVHLGGAVKLRLPTESEESEGIKAVFEYQYHDSETLKFSYPFFERHVRSDLHGLVSANDMQHSVDDNCVLLSDPDLENMLNDTVKKVSEAIDEIDTNESVLFANFENDTESQQKNDDRGNASESSGSASSTSFPRTTYQDIIRNHKIKMNLASMCFDTPQFYVQLRTYDSSGSLSSIYQDRVQVSISRSLILSGSLYPKLLVSGRTNRIAESIWNKTKNKDILHRNMEFCEWLDLKLDIYCKDVEGAIANQALQLEKPLHGTSCGNLGGVYNKKNDMNLCSKFGPNSRHKAGTKAARSSTAIANNLANTELIASKN